MIAATWTSHSLWAPLGLTLAHFVWQGGLIALVLTVGLWLMRGRSAGARYVACGGAMLLMAACPIVTLWYVRASPIPGLAHYELDVRYADAATEANRKTPEPPSREAAAAPALGIERPAPGIEQAAPAAGGEPGLPVTGVNALPVAAIDPGPMIESPADAISPRAPAPALTRRSERPVWLPWVVRALPPTAHVWSCCVILLGLRLMVGWLGLRGLRLRNTRPLPDAVRDVVRRVSQRLGMADQVNVLGTDAIAEPVAFGLLRPVVLLPVSLLTRCPQELVEAMIAHELAHIRRHDLWVNLFQRVVETLLFYHPAVWWVSGRMRLERELCCDDVAVGATRRRADYAEALVALTETKGGNMARVWAIGMFNNRLTILSRVRRVLQLPQPPQQARFWLAGPLSLLLVGSLVFVAAVHAGARADQADPQPSPAKQPAMTDQGAKPGPGVGESQSVTDQETSTIEWDQTPLEQAAMAIGEMRGLSVVGLNPIRQDDRQWPITLKTPKRLTYDDVLTTFNRIIFDVGYWVVQQENYLVIRRTTEWYRHIPPAKMFTSETDYREARLPLWDVALVLYEPKHVSAQSLAGWSMDYVPDCAARASVRPDSSQIELKGFVYYVERVLQIIKQRDVLGPRPPAVAVPGATSRPATGGSMRPHGMIVRKGDTLAELAKKHYRQGILPVRARADGVIAEIKVKLGQTVKKGDLLARLDDEEIEIELRQAKVKLDSAEAEYERYAKLKSQAAVSEHEIRKARSALELASLEVDRWRLRLDRTRIFSPADGMVDQPDGTRPGWEPITSVGKRITAGEEILSIETGANQPAKRSGESRGTGVPIPSKDPVLARAFLTGQGQGHDARLLRLINQERARRGLNALALHPDLSQVARDHASEMARRGFLDHVDPLSDEGLGQRAVNAGYAFLAVGENLARGPTDAEQVLKDWMASAEGQRENLLAAQWEEVGIGLHAANHQPTHWVVVFADPP